MTINQGCLLMPTAINPFNPDILYSFNKLERFINDKKEIRALCRQANDFKKNPKRMEERSYLVWFPENEYLQPVVCLYWKCVAVFIKNTGFILNFVGVSFLGRRCVILGKHLSADAVEVALKASTLFPILNRNIHQLTTSDIYLQPSIPMSQIKDRQILEMVAAAKRPRIDFFREGGVCLGSALWFQYLYENTKGLFDSPSKHIHAVAKQFEKGAPLKAALLQSLNNLRENPLETVQRHARIEEDLLHLKVERYYAMIPNAYLKGDCEKAVNILDELPIGAYKIGVPRHALNFIKIHKNLGYIIDPNTGALPRFIRYDKDLDDNLKKFVNVLDSLRVYLTDPKNDKISIDRFI